jgi:uncharacterized membrane protein YheB (UPF0754 family)
MNDLKELIKTSDDKDKIINLVTQLIHKILKETVKDEKQRLTYINKYIENKKCLYIKKNNTSCTSFPLANKQFCKTHDKYKDDIYKFISNSTTFSYNHILDESKVMIDDSFKFFLLYKK